MAVAAAAGSVRVVAPTDVFIVVVIENDAAIMHA
jgi:hypothetical protein